MPKLTSTRAATALTNGRKFSSKNTKVVDGNLYLFGNHIARDAGEGHIAISNRGHFTLTTKDRLNGFRNVNVSQKNYEWSLNGKPWDGGWVIVAPDGSWVHEVDINCDAAWRR